MNGKWRIEQLSQLVALALGVGDYNGQASGRVRDVPDVRTIRYYTTLGLVDRPSEMHGRIAYYGRRHLLQLVAIKRLQAGGMSLENVQQRLVGVGEKRLATLADLPADFWDRANKSATETTLAKHEEVAAPAVRSASRADFWQAAPQPRSPAADAVKTMASPATVFVLPVAANVRLLIEGMEVSELNADFFDRIAPALAALRNAIEGQATRSTVNDLDTSESAKASGDPTNIPEENEHDEGRNQAE